MRTKLLLKFSLLLFFSFWLQSQSLHAFPESTTNEVAKIKAETWMQKAMATSFEENKGQISGEDAAKVKFVLKGAGMNIFLLENGIAYQFEKTTYPEGYTPFHKFETPEEKESRLNLEKQIQHETFRMDLLLEGANKDAVITTEGKSADFLQYYNHNALDVHSYQKITYHDIYPNIDWVVYTEAGKGIKYDFVVHPGGNPDNIRLRPVFAEDWEINSDGHLILKSSLGEIQENKPVSFQNRQRIETEFVALDNGLIRFNIANYDPKKELIIDPSVVWATYYGGDRSDRAYSVAIDSDGNVYLAGETKSITRIAQGGHESTLSSSTNVAAFLVKFNANGQRLWGTYYGGILSNTTIAYAVAVDFANNVYISGITNNTTQIATTGAHQTSLAGVQDAFLVKFNSSGVRQWGTYYGGTLEEGERTGLTIDRNNNVYLSGNTKSNNNIATSGAHQSTFGGGTWDGFLAKFNSSGTRQWGTYYGGSNLDIINFCVTDSADNIYIGGTTTSYSDIATAGAFQTINQINYDAFVAKFNSSGVRQAGTFYGNNVNNLFNDAVVDLAGGAIYLVGRTGSESGTSASLSTTGAHQSTYGGGTYDALLVKMDLSLSNRYWATYYGGTGVDIAYGCALDSKGNVYMVGSTGSTNGVAQGGLQNSYQGLTNDQFIVKFNPYGSRLWGTYFGSKENVGMAEAATSCALDKNDFLYVAGYTYEPALGVSGISKNGFQSYATDYDATLAKIYGGNEVPNRVVFVDSTYGNNSNDGLSWGQAFKTLAYALNLVQSSGAYAEVDSILVAKGTYFPEYIPPTSSSTSNRDKTFYILRGNLNILGGYPTGGGTRNVKNHTTVLSGNIGNLSLATDNVYHVVMTMGSAIDHSVLVDGFTIKEGYSYNYSNNDGISISGKTIYRNRGAGWINWEGSPRINQVIFLKNQAYRNGGAFYNYNGSPTVSNTVFDSNVVYNYGGAWSGEGAIVGNSNTAKLYQVIFYNNQVTSGTYTGAAIDLFQNAAVDVNNSTIANNSAATTGSTGGIMNGAAGYSYVYNTIIWGNTGSSGTGVSGIINSSPISIVAGYSDIQGTPTYTGTGNYSTNPGFFAISTPKGADGIWGTNDDGLMLRNIVLPRSPLLNQGNQIFNPNGLTKDIIGYPRIFGSNVDMGAYEMGCTGSPITKIYVSDSFGNDANNGTSWATAFKTLGHALKVAQESGCYGGIDSIFVAAGTYYPEYEPPITGYQGVNTGGNSNKTFYISRGNLAILGGYPAAGGNVRNTKLHKTTLSSYLPYHINRPVHVILTIGEQVDSTLYVDGITIFGASSTQGIYADSTAIYVAGHTIYKNRGVGWANYHGSPRLNDVIFENASGDSYGGGWYNHGANANPKLTNCHFKFCGGVSGGSWYNQNGSPTLINTTFFASIAGGVSRQLGIPTLNGAQGGSMIYHEQGNITLHQAVGFHSIFMEEDSTLSAPIHINSTGKIDIRHLTMYFSQSAPGYLVDSIRSDQSIGIYNNKNPNVSVYNSIIAEGSDLNTIDLDGIVNESGGPTVTVAYSNIHLKDSTAVYPGVGNINTSPLFKDTRYGFNIGVIGLDGYLGTLDDGLYLQPNSPSTYTGNTFYTPSYLNTDITGIPRYLNAFINMGAYELACDSIQTVYVDSANGDNNNDGLSWASAFKTLGYALKVVHEMNCYLDVDSILVAEGTYYPEYIPPTTSTTTDRDKTFYIIRNNLKILGGYKAGGGDRNYKSYPTILSGDLGSGVHTKHVVLTNQDVDTSVYVDGFIIQDGSYQGGTFYLLVINGQSFRPDEGGGWNNNDGSPLLNNITFINNQSQDGGAFSNRGANAKPILTNCYFINNESYQYGGAFYNYQGTPTVINSVFEGNETSGFGGAFNHDVGYSKLHQCVFYNNTALFDGGAIFAQQSGDVEIRQSVIYNNTASIRGGGVFNSNLVDLNVSNSIIWGNSAPTVGGGVNGVVTENNFGTIISIPTLTDYVRYSNVQLSSGIYPGAGNLNTNPLFVNTTSPKGVDGIWGTSDDGFYLQSTSTSIGAGHNDSVPSTLVNDFAGKTRILDNVDMGAYEYSCASNGITTLHVDSLNGDDSLHSGRSWQYPFKTLAHALKLAHETTGCYASVDSILVAEGTYFPEYIPLLSTPTSTTAQDKTFYIMRGNLKILGGYPAGGGSRDPITNPTILSGERGNPLDSTDNVYHVVLTVGNVVDSTVLVDGLTITKGGGKIPSINDSATILVLGRHIHRGRGGGWVNRDGSPLISNVKFINNIVIESNNGKGVYGGAVNSENGDLTIDSCVFENNSSIKTNGIAGHYRGGAIAFKDGSLIIRNSYFKNNFAESVGGALEVYGSDFTVINSVFENNSAKRGGAIMHQSSTTTIIQSVFSGNTADFSYLSNGGAIFSSTSSNLEIFQSTFHDNSPTGIEASGDDLKIYNSILWGSSYRSLGISGTSSSTITHSIIQGDTVISGGGNSNFNPHFTNPNNPVGPDGIWGTSDDGLRLKNSSLAINGGDNNMIPSGLNLDFAGNPRIADGIVNMGVYEDTCTPIASATIYVDATNGNDLNTGDSWAKALKTFAYALKLANDSTCYRTVDTILVAQGTYYPTFIPTTVTATTDRDKTFHISRGNLKILGGYPTGGGSRDYLTYPTILSGNINNPTLSTDNVYHVVLTTGTAADTSLYIDGFTIENGYGTGASGSINIGGLLVSRNFGGGWMNYNGSPRLKNIIIKENESTYGGGFSTTGTSARPLLEQGHFIENKAAQGGAWYNAQGNSVVRNSVFEENEGQVGGAWFANAGQSKVEQNIFYKNKATNTGGAVAVATTGNVNISQSTIYENTATGASATGGIFNANSSNVKISNSIIWENTGANLNGIVNSGANTVTATYSNIEMNSGSYSGTGNINADPLFANTLNPKGVDGIWGTPDDGLYLLPASPSINTGHNDSIPIALLSDLAENQRILDDVDMGVFERSCTPGMITTIHVDSVNGNDSLYSGASWKYPFKTLAQALQLVHDTLSCYASVDSILVAKGTYYPEYIPPADLPTTDRDKTFSINCKKLSIIGGYAPGGATRNHEIYPTVLSGDIGVKGDSTDNVHHVMLVFRSKIASKGELFMDGFTIEKGNADGDTSLNLAFGVHIRRKLGGGIYNENYNFEGRNLKIENNYATLGGGLYSRSLNGI